MVNKALSFYRDTVMYANEMNKYPNLDKKLQYQFLLNIVRASKRPYSKWHKKAKNSDLDAVKEYYGYSNEKARSALSVLSVKQLQDIRKKLDRGGHNKSRSQSTT